MLDFFLRTFRLLGRFLLGCDQHLADGGPLLLGERFGCELLERLFQIVRMKYDARACQFNMGTGCVELLLRDGRKISIDCTGVEDALDVTMAQRSELDYLIYNDPLAYAELILNGEPEEYLRNAAGSHGLED